SPSSRSTRARVSGATSGRPLTTFETVGSETPASAAMAASVGRRRCCCRSCPAPTGLVLGTSLPLPRCHPLSSNISKPFGPSIVSHLCLVGRSILPRFAAAEKSGGPPSGDDQHARHQKVRRRGLCGGRGARPRCLQQQLGVKPELRGR